MKRKFGSTLVALGSLTTLVVSSISLGNDQPTTADNTVNGQGLNLMADQLDIAATGKTYSAGVYGAASITCLIDAIATSWYGGTGTGACTYASYGAFGVATGIQIGTMLTTAGKVEDYQKNIGATSWATPLLDGLGGAGTLLATKAAAQGVASILAKKVEDEVAKKAAEESLKTAVSAWVGFAVCGHYASKEGAEAVSFHDTADENRKRAQPYRAPDTTLQPTGGNSLSGSSYKSLDQYVSEKLNSAKTLADKDKLKALQDKMKTMSKECKSLKASDAVACLAQNPAVARAMNDKKLNRLLNDKLGKDLRGLLSDTAQQAANKPDGLRSYFNGIAKKMAPSDKAFAQLGNVDRLFDEAKKDISNSPTEEIAKSGASSKAASSADAGAAVKSGSDKKADADGNTLADFSFDFGTASVDKKDRSPASTRLNLSEGRQSGAPGYGADAWENPAISLFDRVENAYQNTARTLKLEPATL